MSENTEEKTEAPEAEKQGGLSKKKKLIAAAGGAVLLLGAVGGGAAFMMGGGEDHAAEGEELAEAEAEHVEPAEGGEAVYIEVPPMVVNLRSNDGQARFLKLQFMIATPSEETKANVEEQMPMIIDRYQPFLRELRPEDLSGSAAVYRLKEELVLRAHDVVGSNAVTDILIQDMIQQ